MEPHEKENGGTVKNMNILIICVLCTLAHIPSLVLRYIPFRSVITPKQEKILFSIYLLALFLNMEFYRRLMEQNTLTISVYKMNLLLFCIVMALVNIIVIRGYVREHLFTFGLVAVLVLMMTAGSAYLVDLIGYENVSQGLIRENLLFFFLFGVFYLPIKKLMVHTVTPFLNMNGKDYWHSIWFIPTSMFLASLLSVSANTYTDSLRQLISKLFIGIATLFICQSMAQDYERMAENEFLNKRMEEQKQHYRMISDKMKAEQEARHNYKHHLLAMQTFMDTGDVDQLRNYMKQFLDYQPQEQQILQTGNAMVDGILMHYEREAKKDGIIFKTLGKFPENGIQDMDLCNLIGNALDNAMTATKGYIGEKWIKVVSEIDGNMLLINISNSFDGLVQKEHAKILSKKRTMEEGYGIHTMRTICENYDGTSEFTWIGHEFHASFMLSIM